MGNVLIPYQKKVDAAIMDYIAQMGPPSVVRDACLYALSSPGKRIRPCLTLMVSEALGHGADVRMSALGVEFFHTASLVADDLPSMDDDESRRNMPTVHKKFGEGIALLSSYALIAEGYACIAKNAEAVKNRSCSFSDRWSVLCSEALVNATYNTGLNGATGGQFLDLVPPDISLSTIREIIHKKTGSLFEIAFVFGWLFGGGELSLLGEVKRAAYHFGMAFQIADDLGDREQDAVNQRLVNVANVFGEEAAVSMFHEEHDCFFQSINEFGLDTAPFAQLFDAIYRPRADSSLR